MLIALALLAASLSAAPPAPTPPKGSPAALDVEKKLRDGKLDEAIDKGRAAIKAAPDDVDLRLATARALGAKARQLTRTLNVKVTQEDLKKGSIKVPKSGGEGPVEIGYDGALLDEALGHLDHAITLAPKREDLRVFQCYLLTDSSRIDAAKTAITGALAALPKTPDLAKTMIAYGAEREKHHDTLGSVALMTPVAAAFPKEAAIQADYGNALTRLGRKQEAYAALDKALAAAPADLRFARTKAAAAMLLRDFHVAQKAWESVHQASRQDADAVAAATAAYGIDPKASVALFNELATPSPSAQQAVLDLAQQFSAAGTAGPGSEAAMSLAKKLLADGQDLLAIPVLDRAMRSPKTAAKAKSTLVKLYDDFVCPELAKLVK